MYYLLALLLFILVGVAFVKLLSSLVKGCLMTLLVFVLVAAAVILVRSTNNPVSVLNLFVVDNFEIRAQ